MTGKRDVIVIDADGKILDPTRPGQARRLIRSGDAEIHSRDPFAIRLDRVVHHPTYRRRPIVPTNSSSPGQIVSFTEYFREERDIYVQNISSAQISMQFVTPGGHAEPFLLPATKDPVNLTQHVPFVAIRDSADFRKHVNKRPPNILLLTEDEYRAYYRRKAEAFGMSSAEEAEQDAVARATAIRERRPLPDAPEPVPVTEDPHTGRDPSTVQIDDIINPRVLHIIGQVSNPAIEEKDRPPANEVLFELSNLGELTMDDYEYILASGVYRSVKNWAKKEMERLATQGKTE